MTDVEAVAKALISQIGSPWTWARMPPEVRALWRMHATVAMGSYKKWLSDNGFEIVSKQPRKET